MIWLFLHLGYWPSYNVPFYPTVFEQCGYAGQGEEYSHQLAPRAKIFRRDQGKVENFEEMKKIMQYNGMFQKP